MDKSATIIAINRDAYAPIFKFAHFGIVGDLYQIIPEMIQQLKQGSVPSNFSKTGETNVLTHTL
jgi:hypothetical protein